MKPNYDYRHNDYVHIYWNPSDGPESARVLQFDGKCLKLAIGETGRAYAFDLNQEVQPSGHTDFFRDSSGRKVVIRNVDKTRKREKDIVNF